jgi:hypothetical protein
MNTALAMKKHPKRALFFKLLSSGWTDKKAIKKLLQILDLSFLMS